MKIKRIDVWKEDLQLKRPYTIAYETIDSVENLFVSLETENGEIGVGAGSPAEDVTGESVAACEEALNTKLEPILRGGDIRCLRALLYKLEEGLGDTPAALAAADIALHDLAGRCLGLPIVDLLGRRHETMQTSITIGIKPTEEETLEEADEYWGRGFRVFKIKTGHSVEEDVERLSRIRERFGPALTIRVDANQGYSVEDFQSFLSQTRAVDLEFVEQPLKASDLAGMRRLANPIRALSAADESLLTPAGAVPCLCPPLPFGVFNIKLMKCGGIAPGLEIARLAHFTGIDLMWGCMDESIVSITAALHAAFASPATKYLDLDGSLDLAKDLVTGGFVLKDGWMRLTDQPGLGVTRI